MDNKNSSKSQHQPFKSKLLKFLLLSMSLPLAIAGGFLLKDFLFGEKAPSQTIPNNSPSVNPFRDAVNFAMKAANLTQTAKSGAEWQTVANYWKDAIALMKAVPSSAPKYTIAQQKIGEYQRNLDYALKNAPQLSAKSPTLPAEPFRDAVNLAMKAANLTQTAKSDAEWQTVANYWKDAIALMKAIPSSAPKYTIAQQKVSEYQRNLDYAIGNINPRAIASNPTTFEKPEPEVIPANPSSTPSQTEPFRDAVNLAMKAATLTQTAKSQAEWRTIANYWKDAIALMKVIPNSASKYSIAQQKVVEYERYLDYATGNIQNSTASMTLKKVISGRLTPKSVVYSGSGLFFAQNMMYTHTINVYDRNYKLLKTIPDSVNLSKYGYKSFKGIYKGAPVEAAFSHQGKYAWVSNYQMYGSGFNRPGSDKCSPAGNHDPSFLYRIDTQNLAIEKVIKVGAVPKFVATSPDDRFVLVSNWCTWDLSVIDTEKNSEIKRIKLGAYPRGIVVDANSKTAYIAIMGSSNIAKINLETFAVNWLKGVGSAPRHLNIDPNGKYLYVTLNNEGRVAKIDLLTEKVLKKVTTGSAPRSMAISDDGKFLYVVNYSSNTFSKLRTSDMKVVQTVNVNSNPIGITYDPETKRVWVACYSGSILVFQE